MQEIWAECAAQKAAQEEEEDGKREVTVIVSNDNDCHTLDWLLSPHLTIWDSPSATKYLAADIPRLPLTIQHQEESEEEVENTLLDTWPSPPGMPPAGDDMHPPSEMFSGAHPGEEWQYNKIGTPKYFRFLIPDPSIPRCQIIAPWIKYDLNPIRPSISSTFGKYHPVITRPLHPTLVNYICPPLTPQQTAILQQDEPFSAVIDYILQEHLTFDVVAGVQQYRHYDNAH